jgi:ankyrin repeat protein
MPKDKKKGKAATAKATEDFDDMLAEFRAADLTSPAVSPSTSSSSSSSSNISTLSARALHPSGAGVGKTIPEEDMINAAIRGDVKQMKQWARQGVRVHTAEPLCQAAGRGKLESVRCLVNELGADVNLAAKDGCTPLYIAAQEGQTAMARFLVKEVGAEVDKASHTGGTPLYIAAQQGHLEVSCCLVKELGADVNHVGHFGATPCHAACFSGNQRMLYCLVKELGADVNKGNENGFTSLMIAIQKGDLDMVRSLIEDFGADINKATHDGRTPLMMASYHKHAKIVHLLTKHGADSQVSAPDFGTAANVSSQVGAPAELTAYLESKMHCSNPGCSGAGVKKCTGCKQARYCWQACQLAHWPAHKAACKAHQAKAGKGT